MLLHKREFVWVALVLIIGLGFFLRTYALGDWLHFELDQARDARVIDQALEGDPADLPLLGPKAGGTFLRLGPAFYWLEYAGSWLTGDAVVGSAAMVSLFSVAAILIFYILARRFFAAPLALGLTLLFSVSTYLVFYGRFAWNPNLIPFFSLLGGYALLRAVDHAEAHRGRWLVLAAFALGLATQMHFLAFLALPTTAAVFLLIKRPHIPLRFWLGVLAVVMALYLPMILNEIASGGQNAQEFVAAITEKSTKEEHPLIEKAVRNVSEFGLHAIVILTGFEGATFPSVIIKDGVFGTVCDAKCDLGKWYGLSAILLLGLAVLSLVFLWWRESEAHKKDLLLLSLLWLGVSFVLFLPLSYGIAPRFFLLNAPLFFLLLGWLLLVLQRHVWRGRFGWGITAAVIGLLVYSNLTFTAGRMSELARAGSEAVESAPDRILKERIRVTLEQQEAIVDFLQARSDRDRVPIYMFSEPQHRRALKYLMERRGIENDVLGFSQIYAQGAYFLILRTQSDQAAALEKYLSSYTVGERTDFGTLTAIELIPKLEAIQGERQDFSIPERTAPSQAPPRYTLREFWNRSSSGEGADDPDESLDN